MFRFFETAINPFRDHDASMPPANLIGYYARYCRQVWPFLLALLANGLVVALIEVTMLRFVGALVDILRETSAPELLRAHGPQFLGIGLLILIGRPLVGHPKVGSAAPVSGSAVGALAEAEGAH